MIVLVLTDLYACCHFICEVETPFRSCFVCNHDILFWCDLVQFGDPALSCPTCNANPNLTFKSHCKFS
jgi:hypothetical protein